METQIQTNSGIPTTSHLPKAYSPTQYAFVGFFLSLIPVFYMSFSNAKVLPNGEVLRKTMKKFLAAFVLLLVVQYGVEIWGITVLTQGIVKNAFSNPSNYSSIIAGTMDEKVIPSDLAYVEKVVQSSGGIAFFIHLILLILVVRFTNRNELPVFEELKKTNALQLQSMLVPVLLGLGYILFILFFSDSIVAGIAQMLV